MGDMGRGTSDGGTSLARPPAPHEQASLDLALDRHRAVFSPVTCHLSLVTGFFGWHRHDAHAVLAAYLQLLRRIDVFGVLAPAQGQRDRRDNRNQQDDSRDLERVYIV